ncbi:hypothetical protein Dimus_017983, partial [Dionaea muscipula]
NQLSPVFTVMVGLHGRDILMELHAAVRWTALSYVIGLTFGLFARRWMLLHAGLTAADLWAAGVGLLELHATLLLWAELHNVKLLAASNVSVDRSCCWLWLLRAGLQAG